MLNNFEGAASNALCNSPFSSICSLLQAGMDPVGDAYNLISGRDAGDNTAILRDLLGLGLDFLDGEDTGDTGDLADAATCGGESFTGDTKVLTAAGSLVTITKLKPGQKVLATNTKTGKTTAEPIAAVLVRYDTDLYDLKVTTTHGTAVIGTTRNHLFWDLYLKQWRAAAKLKKGEHLKTANGVIAVADGGATPKVRDGWMWDLTVPGNNDHDFYVIASTDGTRQLGHESGGTYLAEPGSVPILVHNTACPDGFDYDAASQSGERADKNGLTRAGREYQKHMGRGELPGVGGTELDSAGQDLLDDILTDPYADYQPVTSGGFAGGYRIIGNSIINDKFVGATYDSSGVFQYFGVYG